jgi:hypothetical protein
MIKIISKIDNLKDFLKQDNLIIKPNYYGTKIIINRTKDKIFYNKKGKTSIKNYDIILNDDYQYFLENIKEKKDFIPEGSSYYTSNFKEKKIYTDNNLLQDKNFKIEKNILKGKLNGELIELIEKGDHEDVFQYLKCKENIQSLLFKKDKSCFSIRRNFEKQKVDIEFINFLNQIIDRIEIENIPMIVIKNKNDIEQELALRIMNDCLDYIMISNLEISNRLNTTLPKTNYIIEKLRNIEKDKKMFYIFKTILLILNKNSIEKSIKNLEKYLEIKKMINDITKDHFSNTRMPSFEKRIKLKF